jgi:tryptophan 2,3-dioxygenase
MQTAIKLPHYLDARERFLRAMGKEQAQQRRLFTLFGIDDAGSLEDAMMQNPTLHAEERKKYGELVVQLDYASRIHDLAKAEQQRKVAEVQKLVDTDIKLLDC